MADTDAAEPTLRRIDVMVCEPCLESDGSECWTPGCAFWSCDAPLVTDALRHCVLATVQESSDG